jgi:hypothetical protein
MIRLSTTRCSCIAILWVSLVSFATITLCVASQRMSTVVYFVMDSVRKILDTPLYAPRYLHSSVFFPFTSTVQNCHVLSWNTLFLVKFNFEGDEHKTWVRHTTPQFLTIKHPISSSAYTSNMSVPTMFIFVFIYGPEVTKVQYENTFQEPCTYAPNSITVLFVFETER